MLCLTKELYNIRIFGLILLFFLCSIFPDENHNHRTCLINSYEHRARPNLDTFVPSPSNHFYIHYDEDGYNAPDSSDEYGMLNQYPNTIPDYVDEVALIADEIRDIMINEFNFLTKSSLDKIFFCANNESSSFFKD